MRLRRRRWPPKYVRDPIDGQFGDRLGVYRSSDEIDFGLSLSTRGDRHKQRDHQKEGFGHGFSELAFNNANENMLSKIKSGHRPRARALTPAKRFQIVNFRLQIATCLEKSFLNRHQGRCPSIETSRLTNVTVEYPLWVVLTPNCCGREAVARP
jgi:hypothetical protein